MAKRNIALGFYQDPAIAKSVFEELKKHHYHRFASIQHRRDGAYVVKRHFPILRKRIPVELIERFKSRVLVDEILIVVQVDQFDVREVLSILRQVKSGHPISFLLRDDFLEEKHQEIKTEPLTMEQLRHAAAELAKGQCAAVVNGHSAPSLLGRLAKSSQILKFLRQDIADAEFIEQTLPVSAEWLLDNMYVIEGSIEDVKHNLPKKYYRELPKTANGLPRIYAIADEIVKSTAGRLSKETISEFLDSYQKTCVLTIGELWALPLMLRLRLIEWIQYLAIHIDNRMREGEIASFWGNRLLYAVRHDKERIEDLLNEISKEQTEPSAHFAEELIDHLFDEENLLPLIREWLEEHFAIPLTDVLHQEQIHETSEQVVFSSCVLSLIALSQLSWPLIFEAASKVNGILTKDPIGIYPQMDFQTRNHYREAVEQIARLAKAAETDVANEVLSRAESGMKNYERHMGYYLIDAGRDQLEEDMSCRTPFLQRLHRWINTYSAGVYLGGILLIGAALEACLVVICLKYHFGPLKTFLFCFLSLMPVGEIAVQLVNFFLTLILPTAIRPRMSYEEGIPEECTTLIVVPMMLQQAEAIQEEIHRLEIRYLGNTDPMLCFGLFSDFSDAKEKHQESDKALLEVAIAGIEALEKKYGTGKFFLFHRQREWSDCEKAWIGWERKRGKLDYLNRFLMGETLPENIVYAGDREKLKNVRYVITLDADTQLPKDQAKGLIEVISHPLNRPYLTDDKRNIARGFTIIQPRVVTDVQRARATWFCKIFSEPAAVDPYTQAISNVYQDLVGEGSYHGKGIYDLEAFHGILEGRFPDAHILSHDLIEGAYVRAGYASNICLFDNHPADYLCWARRKHRWMRGDWQIIDWLLPFVPSRKAKEINPLSWINRWKIFDNLRRALLPLATLLLLLVGWFASPNPIFWTCLAAFVMALPLFFSLLHLGKEVPTDLARSLITISLLPYEALQSLDALFRVAYRRLISKCHLLQWTTSDTQEKQNFAVQLGWTPVFALAMLGAASFENPVSFWLAAPFCLLWALAPPIVRFIDQPLVKRPDAAISEEDKKFLRQIARKTWGYFDEFVGPQTHWLPPDNYQAALNVEIAQRTSPTNTGMWLLALLGAYDLKYITCNTLLEKTLATFEEMKKLERFEGHFLNWYNIQTLEPLYPRYISTVDSGNFLAAIWTLKQGLLEMIAAPIIPSMPLSGVQDTYEMVHDQPLELNCTNHLPEFIATIKQLHDVEAWHAVVSQYFHWMEILIELPIQHELKTEALQLKPSLESLANGSVLASLENLLAFLDSSEHKGFGKLLREEISKSQWYAGEKLGVVAQLIDAIDLYSKEMNLKYLYNEDRDLFAIGYNVDDKRLDTSFYDLLASEARISSLVAIAKEDAPLEHWWALGRLYSKVQGKRVLLSWGGTMFEYLMPLIFNRQYPDSLLGDACSATVACQIDYGNRRGIPWGVSESAFSAIDAHKIYQYKSFGIPGLGLKRGLEDDLIVSPYSSALALSTDPRAAIDNLKRLVKNDLMGTYGFFESIDYTRQGSPSGERGVIVYAYMAHHQGMIFASINNLLNDNAHVRRFHSDPRISGVQSLLYERVPHSPQIKIQGETKDSTLTRLKPFSVSPIMGVVETPESATPKLNLLSNENYSLMITTTGGGYSRWRNIDISRWRSDTTQDGWGSFYYIKDKQSKEIWSAAYQPTQILGEEYSVNFKGDKSEFKRKDHNIETYTEIVVSPEDNAEIRMITLINHSEVVREIELTSYIELVLAPHMTDRAHPAFNKLFIETEALPESSALLAFRRMRSPDDQPLFAAHIVALNHPVQGNAQYETDRNQFIGRGKTVQRPLGLEGDLSNTAGTVLDPIFSLRRSLTLEPGRRVQIAFITAIAEDRDSIVALVEKYKEFAASTRAIELAWAYAQLELRHLRIHQEEMQLFQKLASRILYPHSQLRTVEERLRENKLGQKSLWAQGISGDLPIVVATVGDIYDTDLVKQVLIAHAFWSLRGLNVDLVILNEEATSYFNPLHEQLQNIVNAYAHSETPGGVFLRDSDQLPPEELNLILAVARTVLVAARGSLRQQLVSPPQKVKYPPKLKIDKTVQEVPSRPLPYLELPYFNGLGGFSQDGNSYAIYLGPGTNTPAPWINVIANAEFGGLVSESGLGCAWFGNSQTNRLTPWSNDPVLNPITDTVYIRDEELGTVWTPTASPIRELEAYRATHGKGFTRFEHNSHGINQELTVFVPHDLPCRIQKVSLQNTSSLTKKLSLTAYTEWVLGTEKEETQTHVITEWDAESQAIFAYNRYNPDYSDRVAFASSITPATTFTADRTEFIGRNRTPANPEALTRKSLSGRTGAALDPCAALQIHVEIPPNQKIEVVFILGYTTDPAAARKLLSDCRAPGKIEQLFAETEAWWKKTLETVQIDIPDLAGKFYVNNWLLYQNLSCRFWGRSGFYQSSGACGFRDQLQDSMALVYALPAICRSYILTAASRQFIEGDVQHWWHPQNGSGVRTRFSDDLLWLPFTVAHYVRTTGDTSILEEKIPFLCAPVLEADQHELYQTPEISEESGTLLEHCRRALLKGTTAGPHGLPLIGGGDWNDGMNRVGIEGKGESVWLAWFLIHVMNDFADLLDLSAESGEGYRVQAKRLAEVIEATAWDGEWYRRAYFDDGTPLGSKLNSEDTIDSIAQSWAIISGLADPKRAATALQSAEKNLVKGNVVLLLTPPFDKTPHDPGYIKGYPPGVRENGGQYTHGSMWLAMAFARKGDGNKAAHLLNLMNPIFHTITPEANQLYKVEPYVLAGDVYDLEGQVGRGGWSWYTGSAGWMYRIWLEEALGFQLRGNILHINCSIPTDWAGFKIHYRFQDTHYEITLTNPHHLSTGSSKITLDGAEVSVIHLVNDGVRHVVEIVLLPKEK